MTLRSIPYPETPHFSAVLWVEARALQHVLQVFYH